MPGRNASQVCYLREAEKWDAYVGHTAVWTGLGGAIADRAVTSGVACGCHWRPGHFHAKHEGMSAGG
jgi:hypothetical protein